MADAFGIDISNVLSNAEAIRAARINNTLSQNAMDDQAEARRLTPAALGGDQAATQSLFALDPQRAAQVTQYIGGLDAQKREALARQTDEIGRAAAYVLSSDDPELAYQQVRGMLTPELQKSMPPVFDPQWTELQLANASSIDQILSRNAEAKPPAPVTVNNQLVDPATGKVIGDYRDAPDAPKPTVVNGQLVDPVTGAVVGDYRDAPEPAGPNSSLGKLVADYNAGLIDKPTLDAAILKENALPNGQTIVSAPDGTLTIQQGGGAAPGEMPKLTEGQSKDVGFLTRANAANDGLVGIDQEMTNLVARAANADPTGLSRMWAQSDNFQNAENAALEFKTAILRKDTGAAITPDEDRQYDRLYIPQPGDKQGLIVQKREARQRAVDALRAGIPSAAIASLEEQGLLPKVIEAAKVEAEAAPAAATPAATATSSETPVQLTNDAAGEAAYAALPSGAQFLDPDGNLREKP